MSDYDRGLPRSTRAGTVDMAVDAGLRAFMLGIYNKMALGLLLSAGLAYLTAEYAPVRDLLYITTPSGALRGFTLLGNILRFAPLLIILAAMFGMKNASPRTSGILYWSIVATIGASSGVWLLAFTGASVFMTFLITAAAFGALSLVGYTTKKDLSGMGSFLIMGLWGLLGAMLINMFLASSMMALIVNVLGVAIFAGLTAYDTQRLKMQYYELGGDERALGVATNWGALSLYLDFINLFQFLLSLLGSRR